MVMGKMEDSVLRKQTFARKKCGRLVGAAESLQNGADFSGKTRKYWVCRNGKDGLSATK